jgi:hypothetical protein
MPATFSRYFVESAGNTILAANYNGEFDNIITNFVPAGMDDMSATAAAMRTTVDPGESGTESLATSLEGEIHRIRNIIKEITGKTYWYESPATAMCVGAASSTDNAVARFDSTTGKILQNSTVIVSDLGATSGITSLAIGGALSGVTTLGLSGAITSTGASIAQTSATSSTLKLESAVGSAPVIQLYKGATNNWTIEQNSANELELGYNAASSLRVIDQASPVPVLINPSNIDAASTPDANTLFPNLLIKARSRTAADGTIQEAVNLTCSYAGTGTYDYTFRRDMATANYVILPTVRSLGDSSNIKVASTTAPTTSTFRLFTYGGGVLADIEHYVIVIGQQ